jgi:hypothetical protein
MENQLDELDELQAKFEQNLERDYFCNLIHFKQWRKLRRVYGLDMLLATLSHFEGLGQENEVNEIKKEFAEASVFYQAANFYNHSNN